MQCTMKYMGGPAAGRTAIVVIGKKAEQSDRDPAKQETEDFTPPAERIVNVEGENHRYTFQKQDGEDLIYQYAGKAL